MGLPRWQGKMTTSNDKQHCNFPLGLGLLAVLVASGLVFRLYGNRFLTSVLKFCTVNYPPEHPNLSFGSINESNRMKWFNVSH